ncbi:MAG: hypothetical protein WBW93_09280 [Steroidobacteraceae bacterium]
MPPIKHPPRRAELGIALIAVLWLLASLTMIAVLVAALSLNHLRAVQAMGGAVQTDSVADSAIRIALLHLAASEQRGSWAVPQSRQIELLDRVVSLKIDLENGRLDLNTGDKQLLFALFAANGWSQSDAKAFVARIRDWTDPADAATEGGAELRQYLAAGRDYGPRNAPFESVSELRQVLGGADVSSEILDSLTVYTHARLPDGAVAVPAMGRALHWADSHRLSGHLWLSSSRSNSDTTLGSQTRSLVGQIVRVRACVLLQQTIRCRLTIARITGDPRRPFQVFVWRSVWLSK